MIARVITQTIKNQLFKGKAIILLGPRQVGKTTLIRHILEGKKYLFLDGDDPLVRTQLTKPNTFQLKQIVGDHNLVFIDEAQRIPGIGLTLKILTDQFKHVQILVSGSSSFEIASLTTEPLTGRKFEYTLFPVSWEEFEKHTGYVVSSQQLEHRVIYGMYPDVLTRTGDDERGALRELARSYLFKDVLALTGIRKPELLEKLLRALALQLGNEVSYNELSGLLGADKNTIMRYIQLLEQTFIIFQLNSYNRNLRNEISTARKIYFYDNGIRNIIINNLNPLDMRTDKGVLWENFLIAERLKLNAYHEKFVNCYFWRNRAGGEIDYIEDGNGVISAFEIKWKSKGRDKLPLAFQKEYPAVKGRFVDHENFREFVM